MSGDVVSSLITFLISFNVFVICFNLSWFFSSRKLRRFFHAFPLHEKADWCSRINSTLHGLVVVPGFAITVSLVRWQSSLEPVSYNDLQYVHLFMAISIAYFLVDLIVILLYRVPMWGVFVAHHVVAVIPLCINVFDEDCQGGSYILGLFLLVELPTLSLNMQVFLEKSGRAQSRAYAVFFYFTYVTWILCRLTLPVYLVIVLWNNVFPSIPSSMTPCLGAGIVAAHLITIFCFSVFIFVLTKELRARWQNTNIQDALEVAKIRPGVGDVTAEDLESPLPRGPEENVSPVASGINDEDPDTPVTKEDLPQLPPAPEMRPPNSQEIDWALGVDRPKSVMRHGGSIIR